MQTTFIKICGITRIGDARAAVRSGANAIGFIFARSPRRVTPTEARNIAQHVHPSVRRFGVFVNATADQMLAVVDEAGLDAVQVNAEAAVIDELREATPSLFIAKVIRPTSRESLEVASDFGRADALLFDPKDVQRPEKKSHPIPMDWLKELQIDRMIVAGGLSPDNVGVVVSEVRPWGVDVSSGVESSAGRKDPTKIRDFIHAVRKSDLAASKEIHSVSDYAKQDV